MKNQLLWVRNLKILRIASTSFFLIILVASINIWLYEPDMKDSTSMVKLPSISPQISSDFLADNSTWQDYAVDDDGNGLYDSLIINLGKPEQLEEGIYLYTILKNSSGSWLGYTSAFIESYSTNNITLFFSGENN